MPATAQATYEAKDDQWEGIKKDPSAGCPDKNVLGRYAFTRPPAPGTRPLRDPREPDPDSTEEE
jgi:hypothetical protein